MVEQYFNDIVNTAEPRCWQNYGMLHNIVQASPWPLNKLYVFSLVQSPEQSRKHKSLCVDV